MPLESDSPERLPTSRMPQIASNRYSRGPNFSARLDTAGAARASARMPMKPPYTETTVVRPMAWPASPSFASG
ncbi:hypothetical protein Y695_03149 [Hydrogenophaga sp. T4]|nr:hypothetical protein Y695_03149 [Hydrogenophaga sp. T4]